MAKPVWEPHHDDQLRELHAQELSTRDIGERMGFSFGTIARRARTLGLEFDRSRTAAATHAAATDAKARRAILAHRFLDEANDALDKLHQEYDFVAATKEGIQVRTLNQPDAGAYRNFMTSAGIATDKALALDKHDTDSVSEVAKSMLEKLLDLVPDAPPSAPETPAQDAIAAATADPQEDA
ncbi:hypothetical protein JN535_08680 [Cellulosimicrobium cellulans]|uniref:hypothetical protein n=1 Tax=Cellulosimicrobium cellulans TaxID=1710 RepID=UPI001966210C|nr:hypothetical protein [Cellulosimicrobium cellulans]MBN0040237.1 hypothetical protein [Cellulosimicrobium cellulans]